MSHLVTDFEIRRLMVGTVFIVNCQNFVHEFCIGHYEVLFARWGEVKMFQVSYVL